MMATLHVITFSVLIPHYNIPGERGKWPPLSDDDILIVYGYLHTLSQILEILQSFADNMNEIQNKYPIFYLARDEIEAYPQFSH